LQHQLHNHDAGGQGVGPEHGIFEAQVCGIDEHHNLLQIAKPAVAQER
jgi:hypothetical protein